MAAMSARIPLEETIADSTVARRIGAGVASAVGLAFLAWVAGYAFGFFPWLGFAWLTRASFGVGPIGIVGETGAGTSLGVSTFLFFKGQEVVIDYDADIRAGSLWFYVYKPFDGVLGDGTYRYVTESGSGEWSVPIRQTGIYHITVDASPVRGKGRGWDLDYTAWWGARQAR
jgi:hypothetical protein